MTTLPNMKLKTSEVLIFMLFVVYSWEIGWASKNLVNELHNKPNRDVRKLQQVGFGTNVCTQRLNSNSVFCFSSLWCGIKCKSRGPAYGGECRAGLHLLKKCYCNMPCGIQNPPSAPVNPAPTTPVDPPSSAHVHPPPGASDKRRDDAPMDDYPSNASGGDEVANGEVKGKKNRKEKREDVSSDYALEGDEPVGKKDKQKKNKNGNEEVSHMSSNDGLEGDEPVGKDKQKKNISNE